MSILLTSYNGNRVGFYKIFIFMFLDFNAISKYDEFFFNIFFTPALIFHAP